MPKKCYFEPCLFQVLSAFCVLIILIKVPSILLIAFCGKFYSFCVLIMPKLLSRSKHEEFESNSALQIRDQKERRAKSEEKWSIAKFGSCSTVPSSSSVPHAARSCFLRYALFAFAFGFFFPFYPCNSLPILFFFFFVNSLTLSIYISLSL